MGRDTKELQKLIETHFESRKAEDADFDKFEQSLADRKSRRDNETQARAERTDARRTAEEERERQRRDEEEALRAEQKENKMASAAQNDLNKKKYMRTDEQKANSWNSRVAALYMKMSFG